MASEASRIVVLVAGLVLALMAMPFMTAVMRDMLAMTPNVLKESAYGCGATMWEVTRHVSLRHTMHGMAGAVFLGMGRAVGETMAVLTRLARRPTRQAARR